jgi:hypothetical protein
MKGEKSEPRKTRRDTEGKEMFSAESVADEGRKE